jgi:hypothetical protein
VGLQRPEAAFSPERGSRASSSAPADAMDGRVGTSMSDDASSSGKHSRTSVGEADQLQEGGRAPRRNVPARSLAPRESKFVGLSYSWADVDLSQHRSQAKSAGPARHNVARAASAEPRLCNNLLRLARRNGGATGNMSHLASTLT